MAAVTELAPVVGIQAACAVRIGPLSPSGGAGIRAELPA